MAIRFQAAVVAAVLTLTTSSQGLLTTASKTDGAYKYIPQTVPFLAEVVKLLISSILYSRQKPEQHKRASGSRKQALLYLIPSIIYCLHNNVQFLTLEFVDAATYQLLGNLKIVTTGLLFWAVLHRRLSILQWLALLLLMIGTTTSQITSDCLAQRSLQAPLQGYALGILSAFLSAVAAIYTEWVMKRNNQSLHWQNIQLYTFGVLVNALGLALKQMTLGSIFQGYDWVTLAVVLNLACSGLLVSWVMKFADSIMKVFATSMAMAVTAVASVLFLNLVPSLQLVLGILTASIALILYYGSSDMLLKTDTWMMQNQTQVLPIIAKREADVG